MGRNLASFCVGGLESRLLQHNLPRRTSVGAEWSAVSCRKRRISPDRFDCGDLYGLLQLPDSNASTVQAVHQRPPNEQQRPTCCRITRFRHQIQRSSRTTQNPPRVLFVFVVSAPNQERQDLRTSNQSFQVLNQSFRVLNQSFRVLTKSFRVSNGFCKN